MHIILGATGHIGSALVQHLLLQDEPVLAVLHDPAKASAWQRQGAQTAVADVHNVKALRQVFQQGHRLFLLNPSAAPATDTATTERQSVASILQALEGSGLEEIVAESTYRAQPGQQLGDLGVLYELEQQLGAQPIPTSIIRAAYYMSNWDASLQTAQQEGKVYTFYPATFKLPMVAPQDLAQAAARLLTEPVTQTGLHYVEGPALYSSADVAAAFATALHQPVEVVEIPRSEWLAALHARGFSQRAAQSLAQITAATLAATYPEEHLPERGATSLQHYVQELVRRQHA